jgi:hypothetical protein
MKSGTCPKCQSSNVFRKKKGINYSRGVYVYTGAITRVSPHVSYACADCGYFENYITDRDKLADIVDEWERV